MTGNELAALSIADLQSLLRRREVSPRARRHYHDCLTNA
jgi:predicted HTH domain antitoxin